MITDEKQYRALTFNVAGFALMTPAGKIVLEYVSIYEKLGLMGFMLNLALASLLFIGGLTLLEFGRSILDRKKRY